MDKNELLKKIKSVIKSRNKARKLEPLPLDLSDEELEFIEKLPQLNSKFAHTFSLDKNEEGRPVLKVVNNYIKPDEKFGIKFEVSFVSDGCKDADAYDTRTIMMMVKMLNDYQELCAMVKHNF
jgi:hypothetical protein